MDPALTRAGRAGLRTVTVPNASHWDVVLDARSPSSMKKTACWARSRRRLDDEERAGWHAHASNSFQARVGSVVGTVFKHLGDDRIALPRDAHFGVLGRRRHRDPWPMRCRE